MIDRSPCGTGTCAVMAERRPRPLRDWLGSPPPTSAPGLAGLAPPTSAPGLLTPVNIWGGVWAHPPLLPSSAPGLGSPLPTSAPGLAGL